MHMELNAELYMTNNGWKNKTYLHKRRGPHHKPILTCVSVFLAKSGIDSIM